MKLVALGIMLYVVPAWVTVDACRYPRAAWATAGHKKWFWLTVPSLSMCLSVVAFLRSWTVFGVALLVLADGLAGLYLAKVRVFVQVGHGMQDRDAHRDRRLAKWWDKFWNVMLPWYGHRN